MDAPSAEEQQKFDKLVVQEVKTQDAMSLLRDQSSSTLKKQINDNIVAPKALVEKTQASLKYQQSNPRPPSGALNKPFESQMKHYDEEKYDEDEMDDFEADDQDGDLKL